MLEYQYVLTLSWMHFCYFNSMRVCNWTRYHPITAFDKVKVLLAFYELFSSDLCKFCLKDKISFFTGIQKNSYTLNLKEADSLKCTCEEFVLNALLHCFKVQFLNYTRCTELKFDENIIDYVLANCIDFVEFRTWSFFTKIQKKFTHGSMGLIYLIMCQGTIQKFK